MQAFLQLAFDEDLPPKCVSLQGSQAEGLQTAGKPLWNVTGTNGLAHGWMEEIGFIRSGNDKAVWYHPSGLRAGSHEDPATKSGLRNPPIKTLFIGLSCGADLCGFN